MADWTHHKGREARRHLRCEASRRVRRESLAAPVPSVDKAFVLKAMDELVGAGLATWSTSVAGNRRLCLASGQIFEFGAVSVRRVR